MNNGEQFFNTSGGGYAIERSLRFNSSDSAYLSKNFASAGNRKTWTWAGWVKRSALGSSTYALFSSNVNGSGNPVFDLKFETDKLWATGGISGVSTDYEIITQAVFRDCSAWAHIVYAFDSTNATSSDRTKIYVNGTRITVFDSSVYPTQYPTLNYQGAVNNTYEHKIGRSTGTGYVSSYLADIHFIDGQALDPTSFGEFDDNGIWQPKKFTGTYGTNGFKLDFADNSSNTATTLGKDSSGNGNNWTPNNLSVTAGAGNDSLVDTPTSYGTDTGAGGEVRGNYATLNPLFYSTSRTYSNGNLEVVTATTEYRLVTSTIPCSAGSGKWYAEMTLSSGGTYSTVGLYPVDTINSNSNQFPGDSSTSYGYAGVNGQKYTNNSGSNYGATWTSGDIIGIAFDAGNGTLTFYKNGVSQGQAFSSISTTTSFLFCVSDFDTASAGTYIWNFGQRPFAYTAPSGFKALCDTNLPAPVVAKPSEVMDILLWTGNGTSPRSFSGLSFSPDLVWIKQRSSTADHALIDTVRGPAGNSLSSNLTSAESNAGLTVNSFDTNGFTLATGSFNFSYANTNATTYVGWAWDAGSSTVTNTDGSITSQVRANPSAGFSVVTVNSTTIGTIGHGLGVKPAMIIEKCRGTTSNWYVRHQSLGDMKSSYLRLNLTNAAAIPGDTTAWNNTEPTSTTISINNNYLYVNGSVVYYCFAPVAGYSAFGSYIGNGSSTDGPFVYTGFRSRWVLVKRSDSAASWQIYDTERGAYNVITQTLAANESTAESGFSSGYDIDLLSNGFKPRSGPSNAINTSGGTYIYAAFAENPFQYARAR